MLSPGAKIGPYEITGALGAGGMGEVYRARDTKLNRDVAIKVLPEAFAADPQRMARFEREAQVLASLNHPNIAAIYGLEESGSTRALVMELVEGQTLAERIGTAQAAPSTRSGSVGAIHELSLRESLQLAKQVAEALEYANDRGVVHRDLKPANIKITPDGAVKVLDFGLAKAMGPDEISRDASNSPTLSLAATQAGFILGTAAYMAPEQAKAKPADRRCDIWAFGVVLFEMFSGKKAFDGETISDVLAAVIMREPDWSALPETTPPSIQRLIRRCLNKDPKQRLQAIGEARITIEETISGVGAGLETRPYGESAGAEPQPAAPRSILPWAIAALAVVGLLVALSLLLRSPKPAPSEPMELSLTIPPGQQLHTSDGPAIVISPDGSRIAYVVGNPPQDQIYIRDLDKSEAVRLEGANGTVPFFSPDSRWLGFFSDDGKLEIISVFGGAPFVVANANSRRGASWGKNGIVFPEAVISGLSRVAVKGGEPVPVTHLDRAKNQITNRWPQILPGDKDVLFTASTDNNNFGQADVEAASVAAGKATVLVQNAFFGRYIPSGYLTYISGGTLFAEPFDAKELKLTGPPMPVVRNIQSDLTNGSAQLSFSQNGTAVYLTGQGLASQVMVALVDRKGNATPLLKQPGDYFSPEFSPDGKRLLLQAGVGNVEVYDLARKTLTPLTYSNPQCIFPVWTPDGKHIVCERPSSGGIGTGLSWLASDGTGSIETLTKSVSARQLPFSFSPDGKTLAFADYSASGGCCSISLLPVSPDGKAGDPRTLFKLQPGSLTGGYYAPAFSPDGHWLAFSEYVSGLQQVFVVPYPGSGGKWQVSVSGGEFPVWSRTGHELFFPAIGDSITLYGVSYQVSGHTFEPGTPRVLFSGDFPIRSPYRTYDAAPDGNHFVMFEQAGSKETAEAPPTVVLNWFTRVAQIVARAQK